MPCVSASSVLVAYDPLMMMTGVKDNDDDSVVSPTSGARLNEDSGKSRTPPTPSTSTDRQHNTMAATNTPKRHHSFSIDALVGNTPTNTTKHQNHTPPVESNEEMVDVWQNHLDDFKRFQLYYQQLYRENFPLKHLYEPMQHHGGKQHDQLLSYYTSLYLQRSTLYQNQYLDAIKSVSHMTPELNTNRDFVKKDENTTNSSQDSVDTDRTVKTESEQCNSSQDKGDKDVLSWYGDSNDSYHNDTNGTSPTGSPLAGYNSAFDKPPVRHTSPTGVDTYRNLYSHSIRENAQSGATSKSNFYPSYCGKWISPRSTF